MRIAILAVILIFSTQFIPVTALTDNEKNNVEAVGTSLLMKSEFISYGLVEIDYGNTMKIWFISSDDDQSTVASSLGMVVGVYLGACKMFPEISDLKLMVGTKNNVAGELYAERAWADGVRMNPDGSYNSDDVAVLGLKVLGTYKDR